MKEKVEALSARLDMVANHIVICNHCINCRKAEVIVIELDHIKGELVRALLPKTTSLLYSEPMARNKRDIHSTYGNITNAKNIT